jgi:DNA-directed RNA polymerase specialized sigma24 family protein
MLNPPPTPEELKHWKNVANRLVEKYERFYQDHLSLGPEEYAAEAIAKLVSLDKRPEYIEGWLKTVITNEIKNHKKLKLQFEYPDGNSSNDADDLATQIRRGYPMSLGTPFAEKERLDNVLASLSPKDREIISLNLVYGYDTSEIALFMDYASAKVVANRLKIILAKLRETMDEQGNDQS